MVEKNKARYSSYLYISRFISSTIGIILLLKINYRIVYGDQAYKIFSLTIEQTPITAIAGSIFGLFLLGILLLEIIEFYNFLSSRKESFSLILFQFFLDLIKKIIKITAIIVLPILFIYLVGFFFFLLNNLLV